MLGRGGWGLVPPVAIACVWRGGCFFELSALWPTPPNNLQKYKILFNCVCFFFGFLCFFYLSCCCLVFLGCFCCCFCSPVVCVVGFTKQTIKIFKGRQLPTMVLARPAVSPLNVAIQLLAFVSVSISVSVTVSIAVSIAVEFGVGTVEQQ